MKDEQDPTVEIRTSARHDVANTNTNENDEDQVIDAIGKIGRWQLLYGGLLIFVILDNAASALGSFFMNAPTDFWCVDQEASAVIKNECFYQDVETNSTKKCESFEFDRSQFKRTFVQDFQLVCGKEYLQHWLQVAGFLGSSIGNVLFGAISDFTGRRMGLMVSVIASQCLLLALILAPTAELVILVQLLHGICGSIRFMISFIWVMECVAPKYKMAASMICNMGWLLSMALQSTIMYITGDWTAPFICSLASTPVMLFVAIICPESPKWLLSMGRIKEAEEIMRKAAKMNGRNLEDNFKLRPITSEKHWFSNPIKLFSKAVMASKMGILLLNYFAVALLYFGLTLNSTSLSDDLMLQFVLNSAVEVPATFLGFFIIYKCPRKLPHCLLLAMGGIALIISALIPSDAKFTINALALVGKYSSSVTWLIAYVMVSEVVPTDFRAMGSGLCALSSRIPGMVAPFIASWLSPLAATLPLAVFGSFALSAATAALFLPETRCRKLPDTIEEAETMPLSIKDGFDFCCTKHDESRDYYRVENTSPHVAT